MSTPAMKPASPSRGATNKSPIPAVRTKAAAGPSKQPPNPPAMKTVTGEGTGTTGKPSRRAQGWHTAVDSGDPNGGTGSETVALRSALSSGDSNLRRKHSVQFSEDVPKETPSSRSPAHAARPANPKEEAAFRQNMVDFLGVMYGEKSEDASSASTAGPSTAPASTFAGRASMYRSAVSAPTQSQSVSPNGGAGKGPQIRGKVATDASAVPHAPSARLGGKKGSHGDNIDVLVDHLVRAYSSRMGIASDRGKFATMDDGTEAPISYNSGRSKRGPVTGRRSANDQGEVSTFVSQALDSFLDPSSVRGNTQLASTKSMLSSLGLDEDFAKLVSFKTRSNLPAERDEADDEETQLQPVYIGEQAMFRSVGSRPAMEASVSKSMGVMRGVIPASPADGQRAGRAASKESTASSRGTMEKSLDSAALAGPAAKPAAQRQTVPVTRLGAGSSMSTLNQDKSFTLDSHALLDEGKDADDSWGDVDAEADALAKKEREKAKKKEADRKNSGSSTVVHGARSLLELAKERTAIRDLLEAETLSRNVVSALEQQLREYVVSAFKETGTTGPQRGRRKSSEGAASVASPLGSPAKQIPAALKK